jgi:hypothetical protein
MAIDNEFRPSEDGGGITRSLPMKHVILFLAGFLLFSEVDAASGNIAFGYLKGVKIYDWDGTKEIRLHFSEGVSNMDIDGCNGVAIISESVHTAETLDRMLTLAVTAYTAGRKIRAYSQKGTCEADFLSLQDSIF